MTDTPAERLPEPFMEKLRARLPALDLHSFVAHTGEYTSEDGTHYDASDMTVVRAVNDTRAVMIRINPSALHRFSEDGMLDIVTAEIEWSLNNAPDARPL